MKKKGSFTSPLSGRGLVFACICVASISVTNAQTFTNIADEMGISAIVVGGNFDMAGCSFADFNKDGFDDITFGVNGAAPQFYLNNNGTFQNVTISMQSISKCKGIMWVDYDNDGDRDLFISNEGGANRLMRNDGDFSFTNVSATSGLFLNGSFNYGASWGDYDLDGDLDVYISNYAFVEGPNTDLDRNHLFRNDGIDTFTDVTAAAGFDPLSELSFQTVWFDYDHDLYPDLFLINDKQFQNRAYHNNGDGTFSEISDESGFGINVDSMSASFGDFNNDLIVDFYTTNLPEGNVLLKGNADFTFTDVTASHGLVINDFTWGAAWFDMDNDADLDIYIAESQIGSLNAPNYLLRNTGEGNNYWFEDAVDAFISTDNTNAYSVASGDLDNDGNIDLIVNNRSPHNAVVWKNNGNDLNNGFIKVDLQGTQSNIDGVGSLITVWFDGNARMTYTMLGEQFISQNSFVEHFGIGQHALVDSVIVQWPSGIIDHYYDIPSGTTLHAVEGNSAAPQVLVQYTPCSTEPATIQLSGENILSITWDNGSTGNSFSANNSGTYSASVELASGNSILVSQVITLSPPPNIVVDVQHTSCFNGNDGEIALFVTNDVELESITWSELETTGSVVSNLGSGEYFFSVIDSNGCTASGSAIVESPSAVSASVSVEHGNCPEDLGSANITASGGNPPYTIDWQGQDPLQLVSGEYTVIVADANGCLSSAVYEILNPTEWVFDLIVADAFNGDNGQASINVSGATPPYFILWSNGQQTDAIEGLMQGNYFVVVQDSHGCFVQENFQITDLSVPFAVNPIVLSSLGNGQFRITGILIESYTVFDSMGQLVVDGSDVGSNDLLLDLSGFSHGGYIVVINKFLSIKVRR